MGLTRKLTTFLRRHGVDKWAPARDFWYKIIQPIALRLNPELVIAVAGGTEEFQMKLFLSHIRPGDTFVDLGAHMGYYTLPAARAVGPSGRVFAFEPESANRAVLEKMVRAQGAANTTVIPKAVSNRSGGSRLYLSADNTVDHHAYDSHDGRRFIDIETTTLDDHFAGIPGGIDLIKIDIQGAELAALEGMRGLLAKNRNAKLFVEYWPAGLKRFGSRPRDVPDFLAGMGYSLFDIDERLKSLRETSAAELPRLYPGDNEDYTNLFCVKS